MITQVNFRPKFYSPAYNPIIWSVTSDKAGDTTVYNFQYVFDVYVNGSIVNRLKQRPNPSLAGMVDVSLIVQSFQRIGNFANEYGVAADQPLKTGYDAVCSVYLAVGEEYASTALGTPVLYNGKGVAGNPAYIVGAQGFVTVAGSAETSVIALPWTLDWAEQQKTLSIQNISNTDYYGLFGSVAPFVLKNSSLLAPTSVGGLGQFLSDAPRSIPETANWRTSGSAPAQNISIDNLIYDRNTLSFLNRNPIYQYYSSGGQYPYQQAAAPLLASFQFYNSAGTNLGHYYVFNYENVLIDSVSVYNGGSPRANCGDQLSYSSFPNSANAELVALRVGPKDLDDMGVFTSLGSVPAYYTVQLFGNITINSSCVYSGEPSVPLSELVTINIIEDCTSYLYPRVRLAWLNPMGGRDYWNFTMFAEQTIDGKGLEYYQTEVQWGLETPVVTSNSGDDRTENWIKGGDRSYNKLITNSWKITSDWLTQEQVDFLKNSLQSPQRWAYIGQEDFPYTCKIVETNYTVKTIKMVKVYNVTFTIETAVDRTMQTI